jgi:hypothetical protein
MRNTRIFELILILLLFLPTMIFADSPITSTDFYEAYKDIEIVRKAEAKGVIDDQIAAYLSSPFNPIGVKAAVINALSWDFDGKNNMSLYWDYLSRMYRKSREELRSNNLTADEVFSVGYLAVMDNYFYPERAIPWLEEATSRRKESFTVAMMLALTKAQEELDKREEKRTEGKDRYNLHSCNMWKLIEEVLENKRLKKDLSAKATNIIVDYMVLYKGHCE